MPDLLTPLFPFVIQLPPILSLTSQHFHLILPDIIIFLNRTHTLRMSLLLPNYHDYQYHRERLKKYILVNIHCLWLSPSCVLSFILYHQLTFISLLLCFDVFSCCWMLMLQLSICAHWPRLPTTFQAESVMSSLNESQFMSFFILFPLSSFELFHLRYKKDYIPHRLHTQYFCYHLGLPFLFYFCLCWPFFKKMIN